MAHRLHSSLSQMIFHLKSWKYSWTLLTITTDYRRGCCLTYQGKFIEYARFDKELRTASRFAKSLARYPSQEFKLTNMAAVKALLESTIAHYNMTRLIIRQHILMNDADSDDRTKENAKVLALPAHLSQYRH